MNVKKCCNAFGWALTAVFACAAIGCGSGRTERCALAGEVTLDGKPVDGGNIQIEPIDSQQTSASGALIQAGRYSIPNKSGLVPGKYRVRIYLADKNRPAANPTIMGGDGTGPGASALKELIPAKYNTRSELSIEVQKGIENVFDFTLSTSRLPGR